MATLPSLDAEQFESLSASFGGALICSEDDGYNVVWRVHNGLIDCRLALIARCSGASDVAAAVRFGGKAELLIAICGGGYNVAG